MSFFGRRVSNRAFTIVELLTVMAVIAILSAILLPVLGGVIRSGEQAESLNRMRQIGQWMQLYAQDSNDVVSHPDLTTADNVLLAKQLRFPTAGLRSSMSSHPLAEALGPTFFGFEIARRKRIT
ncbi:MAG: type II secretion system protein [Planctomycetota bacterium]|nr:type II secretion system protein [Planctomycetota bacterium]